jgi:hypothetical protein
VNPKENQISLRGDLKQKAKDNLLFKQQQEIKNNNIKLKKMTLHEQMIQEALHSSTPSIMNDNNSVSDNKKIYSLTDATNKKSTVFKISNSVDINNIVDQNKLTLPEDSDNNLLENTEDKSNVSKVSLIQEI